MYRELLSFSLFGRSITLYSYGVFVSLALILGILIFYQLAKEKKLNTEGIFDNIVATVLAGLGGARLGHVLLHLDYYRQNPGEVFKIWQGGLTFYGAFVAGFIYCLIWFLREERQNLWQWLDAGLVALVLGKAVGKIGCFLNGCCYGRETSHVFGMRIPVLEDNILRHPVQIYEALAYFFVFTILFWIGKGRIFSGFVFFFGLILHTLSRFSLEYFREWTITFKVVNIEFSDAQLICAIIIACAIIGLILRKRYYILKRKIE